MTELNDKPNTAEQAPALTAEEVLALPRHYAALLRGTRDVIAAGDVGRLRRIL